MKQERDKPYTFIAPRTGNLYAVIKHKSKYHLKVRDSGSGKYVKGEVGIMTMWGHKTLREANEHAKMVEQMFLQDAKGGKTNESNQ